MFNSDTDEKDKYDKNAASNSLVGIEIRNRKQGCYPNFIYMIIPANKV